MPGLRVLLVDDEPEFLGWAHTLFSSSPQLEVAGLAKSGPEAIALASRIKPQVALVDINMPGMSGFATARRLLAECPELRLLLVSASSNPEYGTLAREMGAAGFLAKRELSVAAVIEAIR